MTVFSKIPAGQFEELHPLIEQRVAAITKNADDVMQALNSAEINYDKAKLFLTSLSPELIEAIHKAFEGDDDAEQTLKIITCLLDKDFIIEALNRLSIVESTLLLRAFAKNGIFTQKALYTINDFGYEGKFIKIILLFKEMLIGEDMPKRQRQGVSPIPIKACESFLEIAGDLTDSILWENLSQKGLISAFEKVLTSAQNKKIVRSLLKDKPFMFVLSCINNKEALIHYLCDLHKTEEHVYLSEIYATHFVLFDKLGILISNELFPILDQDESLRESLTQLVDVKLDPSAKLLACVLYCMYDKGYQNIDAFVDVLNKNPGMKDALCRLFNWKKNTIQEIFTLTDWINRRFIKGKDKFKFPSHQNTVIQDDYLYQWLERAKTTI